MRHPVYERSDGKSFAVHKYTSIIKVWAAQSLKQIHEAYNQQKMWNGKESNSVWAKDRARYILARVNGDIKRTKVGDSWNWYKESKLREKLDKQSGPSHGKYWYSTGHSADVADVKVVNGSIEDTVIDFTTTIGEIYADVGVGLNGKYAVRGAKARRGRKRIKVDRSKPWHHYERYVSTWTPGQGKSHRPVVRHQVSLLRRRLEWAARQIFQTNLQYTIAMSMEEAWNQMQQMEIIPGVTAHYSAKKHSK